MQTTGLPDLFTPNTFAVTSIDNVDRLFVHSACTAADKSKTMNATSFQAVIPTPNISQSVSLVTPLFRNDIPVDTNFIRHIKIYGNGKCFFRAIEICFLHKK